MCSFDFDELQMDARRDYLMKGLKKRCMRRRKHSAKNIARKKPRCKVHDKTKFKKTSFDEPGTSRGNDDSLKEKDFKSFTKLADFPTDYRKNVDASYSNKKGKPLRSYANNQNDDGNKDDDSPDLDHVCADMLKNNIDQIKTQLGTSKEKSRCIKPQRVNFGEIFNGNKKSKCVKKKNPEDDVEANAENKATSRVKQTRMSREDTSDTPVDFKEENENIGVYRSNNVESKHKSQKRKPENNESVNDSEDDTPNDTEKEDEYANKKKPDECCSCQKQAPEINPEGSRFSKRKQETNESTVNDTEDDTRNDTEKEEEYVNKRKPEKCCSCKRRKPKINPEGVDFVKESSRKQSQSNGSMKSERSLSRPSSSVNFEFARKANDSEDLECECQKSNSRFSLDCESLLAAKKKEREKNSFPDLSCCTCEQALKRGSSRRERRRSPSTECEKYLNRKSKKKKCPKVSPSCEKLLKSRRKKKISSACEKLLKGQETPSCCSCKKLPSTHKKKKKRRRTLSSECKRLLKADRKKKSASICTCKLPKRKRRRRRSYRAPVLEDCENELNKMKQSLSNKILLKESQLLKSGKKGKRKKRTKCKPEEPQDAMCRCATSDLKDRYTKMIEDYHRLKRQYDALKCTNAIIEKKLRRFMRRINCECTR